MPRPRLLALSAALTAFAAPAVAQEIVHHAQGIELRLSQTLRLTDPWEQTAGDAIFEAEPRDVETRIRTDGPMEERVQVQLLLHGAWGWFHLAYDEVEILRRLPDATGRRTLRFALDVDGDEENEIVLLERTVATQLPVDENGEVVGAAVPLYSQHRIRLRYLDRSGGVLSEQLMSGDPDDAGFAAILATELGGPVNAALQLLAGDYLFSQKRYGEARYRYQVAREWAERTLSGQRIDELPTEMTLLEPDPDRPEFTWITARLRHGALPPFFQRRR